MDDPNNTNPGNSTPTQNPNTPPPQNDIPTQVASGADQTTPTDPNTTFSVGSLQPPQAAALPDSQTAPSAPLVSTPDISGAPTLTQPTPTFISSTSDVSQNSLDQPTNPNGTLDLSSLSTNNSFQNPPEVPEPAPTDLSQLADANGASNSTDVYNPPVSSPETLVVPTPTPTTVTAANHKVLPVLTMIGAIVVILVVAGASAYFILGIGKQASQNPGSVPINQQPPLSNPPAQNPTPPAIIKPTPVAIPSEPPSSGGSSTFGEINGEGEEGSQTNQTPTSAADLIKKRQQQNATPTP